MFRHKTVFVLGAGASFEAGMPTGVKLAENISTLLDFRRDDHGTFLGNRRDLSFFQRHGLDLNCAKQISDGIRFSNSIDEYIDRMKDPNIERLGKLAIAYEILNSEKHSKLAVDPSNVFNGLETTQIAGSWYLHLARMLFRSTDVMGVDRLFQNLSFIDFNYDRCLDQFFRFAIRDAYSVDASHADALVETLKHPRPYGSIGNLQTRGIPNGIPYGCDPHTADIEGIVSRIKTYTEQVETKAVDEIKEEFASAHTVVFLGFGFHEQNMRLLAPKDETDIRAVLATGKGLSESDMGVIGSAIQGLCRSKRLGSQNTIVRDLTCGQLFEEFRFSL